MTDDPKIFEFNGNRGQVLSFLDWLEGLGHEIKQTKVFDPLSSKSPLKDELRRLANSLPDGRTMYLKVTLPFDDWVLARLKFGKR